MLLNITILPLLKNISSNNFSRIYFEFPQNLFIKRSEQTQERKFGTWESWRSPFFRFATLSIIFQANYLWKLDIFDLGNKIWTNTMVFSKFSTIYFVICTKPYIEAWLIQNLYFRVRNMEIWLCHDFYCTVIIFCIHCAQMLHLRAL